jgi:hypothetical protein
MAIVVAVPTSSAKNVLLIGSSPLQASFGGDAVDGSTAANNPSPVEIQRPKPD